MPLLHFFSRMLHISLIPNRSTKFIMHVFKIKTEELLNAIKVTEIMNWQTEYC